MDNSDLQSRGFLTEKHTGKAINTAPSTLRAWRVKGKGPRYYKIGGKILYKQSDLDAWIEAQARTSTSQAA